MQGKLSAMFVMSAHRTLSMQCNFFAQLKRCNPKLLGPRGPRKNFRSHIDASHSRQPLVKGERLVRYEVNAVMVGVVGMVCPRAAQHCTAVLAARAGPLVCACAETLHAPLRDTRLCYPEGCAAPGVVPCQCNAREPLSKLEGTSPRRKIVVTSKSQLRHISCHTDKSRYYT